MNPITLANLPAERAPRSMDQPQSSVWWLLPRAKLATVSLRARICEFVCLGRRVVASRTPFGAPATCCTNATLRIHLRVGRDFVEVLTNC